MYLLENKVSEGLIKVTNRFRGEVTIATRRGARWALAKDNFIENRLLTFRYYEPEQIAYCERFLNKNPVDIFIDVGANFGLYSIHFAKRARAGTVLAFEPISRNYMHLCANILLNGLQDVIHPHQIALSNTACVTTMHVDKRSTGLSRFSRLGNGERYYSEQVRVAVFDDLFAYGGKRAFIKIDTEGHEPEVLDGMSSFLSRNRVFVQLEANSAKAGDFLTRMGCEQIGSVGGDHYFSNF